ncbi:MAG: hypothetical protein PF489_09475 [Salinivirgaceae bacterium]|nr:hypothetical protein [Salinivirgaceae bacterium]
MPKSIKEVIDIDAGELRYGSSFSLEGMGTNEDGVYRSSTKSKVDSNLAKKNT